MSEETIIIEVEPESIKPSSTLLNEGLQDNTHNSEHSNVVVKDTINNTVEAEEGDQEHVKKSLVWDMKTIDDGRHVRRHSASLSFGANRKLVVPSRYRGGSIGSCHDMCKFGHTNTSEVMKPKSTAHLKRTPASQGKGLMKIASSVDNRKKSVVRPLSYPANQVRVSVKEVVEPKGKPTTTAESANVVIKDEEKCLRSNSKTPVKKAASVNRRIHRDPSSSSSHLKERHQTNRQQEAKSKLLDVPEKTLYMIEPNGKCAPAETSRKAPLRKRKLPKTQVGSYIGTRKGSKATQNGSLSKSLFPSSSKSFKLKNEKLEDSELVTKNAVYGHQNSESYTPKLKLGASTAKRNGKHNSHLIKPLLPAVDKPSGSTPRSKPGTPRVKQDVEPKPKAATRGAKSHQNGEGQGFVSVWKMKFRRGKVVSLPSGNNSPVKLKFRRPRGLSDTCHAEDAKNANYKSNEVGGGDPHNKDHGTEPVKVVLRRHETTYKKDDVDLNNVIEETASKLVKTRKSKVKALVGAFETVMSLRNHKAATDTS